MIKVAAVREALAAEGTSHLVLSKHMEETLEC